MNADVLFLTIASTDSVPAVRLMVDSLRTFGGDLAGAPFWVFSTNLEALREAGDGFDNESTRLLLLVVPDLISTYPFGKKIAACAEAERLVPAGMRSLVWIDPSCLVVQPPSMFNLGDSFDAAFRPVHIRNVGLHPAESLDPFWQGIYAALGVEDVSTTVTSFVDGQLLRTYFNSHAFAVNPALGLMRRWVDTFQKLVGDRPFQAAACPDDAHQIFLFQAILSTLVASSLAPARVRILPPTYNYPYHLQERIPADRRAAALDDLVCFTYEDCNIHPDALTGIQVREPLRSWLETRLG